MSELLPCPFCGGKATYYRKGDHRMSTIIRCEDCDCTLETGEEFDHWKQWNTRAKPEPLPKENFDTFTGDL